jgi:hypothetical protein
MRSAITEPVPSRPLAQTLFISIRVDDFGNPGPGFSGKGGFLDRFILFQCQEYVMIVRARKATDISFLAAASMRPPTENQTLSSAWIRR